MEQNENQTIDMIAAETDIPGENTADFESTNGDDTGNSNTYSDRSPRREAAKKNSEWDDDMLPSKNRPLSPWAYWGLTILYAVPLIGLIFLIIHSFSKKNINRRNFARSFWCGLLVAIFIILLLAIVIILGLVKLTAVIPLLEKAIEALL